MAARAHTRREGNKDEITRDVSSLGFARLLKDRTSSGRSNNPQSRGQLPGEHGWVVLTAMTAREQASAMIIRHKHVFLSSVDRLF